MKELGINRFIGLGHQGSFPSINSKGQCKHLMFTTKCIRKGKSWLSVDRDRCCSQDNQTGLFLHLTVEAITHRLVEFNASCRQPPALIIFPLNQEDMIIV